MPISTQALTRFVVLLSLFQMAALGAVNPVRLVMDLSETPDAVMLSAFDLCIVDPQSKVDLEAQQTLGNKMLALVNIFEVKADSEAAKAAASVGVPLLEGSRTDWVRLDATHPNWGLVVVREIVQAAAERGFDGFVLTGLETISQDAERAACIATIKALNKAYPDKQLVIKGGLDLLGETRRELDGVLFVGNSESSDYRDQRIREVKRLGLQALVVDYAPTEVSQEEIAERTLHFRAMGAVPFFTTPAISGIHLGPLKEITKRILVIHSGPARNTFTHKVLHGSLEWLGYQVKYVDAGTSQQASWDSELTKVSGVILDETLQPRPQQQASLLAMVSFLKDHHVPLLLNGASWGTPEEYAAWSECLGLHGTGKSIAINSSAKLRYIEHAWLQQSGVVKPRTQGFRDLQAPDKARVLSSVKADKVFDQVFLTSWGGVWMDALAKEVGPQLQPLPFLQSWLGNAPVTPVLDITSQNGLRLFIPQVSSEGFTATTSLQGLPIAGEAMTERVLSRYSLPFTVAVCEGDLRGTNLGLDPRDSLRYETAARTLFTLPQVHAASASRSRPKDWQNCPEMEREIAGSMAYIHRHLLPAGRHVEMMQWPQGTTPSPAAVAFSRRMGVENMELQLDNSLLGSSSIPTANFWGEGSTHEALAKSPRRQGPLNATAFVTHAETESRARWMSPLHVSLNFQDAISDASLWEVERVLDWCAGQPLHAVSASDYAKLVRDAAQTHIFHQGEGHWIIVNAGYARTLRLPATAGVPDLDRSIGIAGYSVRGDDLYIHTLGRRRTELILSPEGSPNHLRLAGSSSAVRFMEAGQQRALLQVASLRPVELVFAGIQPGAICQVFTTEQPQFIMADNQGKVEMTVPAQTTVRLQVMPSQQAAMR